MPVDPRVRQLLQEILDSGRSPEVVAGSYPELLPQLLEELRHLRTVEAQVAAMFPDSGATLGTLRENISTSGELPYIPGYEIESVLGRGGMGVVYQGRHLQLNRPVAIKMLLAGTCATEAERERFLREAEAAARLQHPNIVQVYDVGDHDGRMYYTMEYVDGGTLAAKLSGVPQPPREAAALLEILSEAVRVAHEGRIIHRDLKPSNILITTGGTPKINDFGLAKQLEGATGLTLTGAALGTPSYMSPEQARGDSPSLGPHVDVYALGALLYELLTGRPPFRAESPSATLQQVISQEPAPPSRLNANVPRDLETICLKCLQKEPNGRYPAVTGLRDDLRRFLNNEPIVARPVGRPERIFRWTRRNPIGAALLLTVAVLFIVVTTFGMKEFALAAQRRLERAQWVERLQFVLQLEKEGRFREARAILGRVPDGGSGHLRGEIESAIRDLDVAEKLEAVRGGRGRFKAGGGLDYDESSREYETVFREAGLGTLQENPAVVAKRLMASTASGALLAALDDWGVCARDEPRKWIFSVARAMDPDPWRDRVRSVERWASKEELERLAEEAKVDEQPMTLLVAMGTRWRHLGGDPTKFLQRVYLFHPDDFWLNFELGFLFGAHDSAEAKSYNRAALALRPDSPAVHFNLGNHFLNTGRYDEGIHHYKQALKSDSEHTWAHFNLAELLLTTGKLEEAFTEFQQAAALDPEAVAPKSRMREIMLRQGHVEEATANWAKVFYSDESSFEECNGYAELCLILGRDDEYDSACDRLLARFGSMTDPQACECLGNSCLLAPPAERLERINLIIERALAADKATYPEWLYPYFMFAKALAEYRSGNYESAIAICEGEAAETHGPAPELTIALAQHKLGNDIAAKAALAKANNEFDWSGDPVRQRDAWMYHLLRREAMNEIDSVEE